MKMYSRKTSRSWSPLMDMFSRDSEHLIKSVEKKEPARHPRSRNWETDRRAFGEGFKRRLYAVKRSCGMTPLLLS